jgi:Fic family protein
LDHLKTYIWQHSSWPLFRWDHARLIDPLGRCRFQQGALLARMGELGFEVKQQARAEVLIEETIQTSAIEGERLDPNAVRSSVVRRLGLPSAGLQPRRDPHVDGVVDILMDATLNHEQPLSSDRLFGWHAALFPTGYSGLHKIRVAAFRNDANGPMRVASGPMGRERVHYEAPPAHRVDLEMQRLLAWWASSRPALDGLLRAAMAHLWFVAIHPFEDGNGRIARTLTEMALAQDENLPTRYYSLSSQIMAERDGYYRVLERIHTGDGDITEWVVWFLECMTRAMSRSSGLLANVMQKARFWNNNAQRGLSPRQSKVIDRLIEAGPGGFEGGLTNRKYAGITHVSKATAQRDIADLVQKGVLRLNFGGGRSTSYDLWWDQLGNPE